jgi:hypothetical protein
VRFNTGALDLASFDLDQPNLLAWDVSMPAFSLAAGASLDVPLGQVLIPDDQLFSQAYVSFTGAETGQTFQDIQQHQQASVPEPASFVQLAGGVFIIGLILAGRPRGNGASRSNDANIPAAVG